MSKRKAEDGDTHAEKKHRTHEGHEEEHNKDGCHLEIPVSNMERAKKFYGEVFGFTFTPWKDEYVLFQCPNPKSVGGGLYKSEGFATVKPCIIMYLHAESVTKKLSQVFANGGWVYQNCKQIQPDSDHGACSTFCDTEGNFLGVYARHGDKDVEVRTIDQTVQFRLKPAAIYKTFTDAKVHADFSGEASEISTDDNGLSKLWGGQVEARNIDLEDNKRIVQCWRCADWPEGHYSRLTIELHGKRGGTELKLRQGNVPAEKFDSVASGWHDRYWKKFEGTKSK